MKPSRPTHSPSSEPSEKDFAPDLAHDLTQNLEQDTELWDLLGKADRPTPVSPFFARNVLREVRLAEARKAESGLAGTLRGLLARWRMLTGGATLAAAVALAATLTLHSPHEPATPGMAQAAAPSATTATAGYDAEIIAQLDELLDDESIWLDSTVSAY